MLYNLLLYLNYAEIILDRGFTFSNVLQGVGRALSADPNNPSRFYATLDNTGDCNPDLPVSGVFISNDFGESWEYTSDVAAGSTFESGGEYHNIIIIISLGTNISFTNH